MVDLERIKPANFERDAYIIHLLEDEGKHYEDVARRVNLTPARIYQIYREYLDVPSLRRGRNVCSGIVQTPVVSETRTETHEAVSVPTWQIHDMSRKEKAKQGIYNAKEKERNLRIAHWMNEGVPVEIVAEANNLSVIRTRTIRRHVCEAYGEDFRLSDNEAGERPGGPKPVNRMYQSPVMPTPEQKRGWLRRVFGRK